MDSKTETVEASSRMKIAKVRNIVLALSSISAEITTESISLMLVELEKSGDIFVSNSVLTRVQEHLSNSKPDESMH
jgi:hypothetical protein